MLKNVIILVLVAVNIILLFVFYGNSSINEARAANLKLKIFQEKYWKEKKIDGIVLNNISIESSDGTANKAMTLKELMSNSLKVVMVHSVNDCNSCVKNEVDNLKALASSIGSENIIFLASYSNTRDMEIFKQATGLKTNVYNLHEQKLNLLDNEIITPFIFLTDSTLTIKSAFVPLKEAPGISQYYYSVVKKKFQEN